MERTAQWYTATQLIDAMNGLQSASYPTIHQYLVERLGEDAVETPLYTELKKDLEATMVREEYRHPAGYTYYEWIDR